jgi:hypothetical protein
MIRSLVALSVLGTLCIATPASAALHPFIDDGVLVELTDTQFERLQNVFYGINDLFPCIPGGPLVIDSPPPELPPYIPPTVQEPWTPPPSIDYNPCPPPTVTGVPETSTWLMLLTGFAAMLLAGRRRHSHSVAVDC